MSDKINRDKTYYAYLDSIISDLASQFSTRVFSYVKRDCNMFQQVKNNTVLELIWLLDSHTQAYS